MSSIEISEPVANKALIWNTTADGLISGPDANDIANAQTNAANAAQSAADAQAAEQNVISIQNQLSPGNLKISANDTTANYVELKIIEGTGIEMTTNNEGGNETRTVALDSAASAISKVQLVSNFV